MPHIKPEKLTSGDTIGVIAPASRPTHPGSLDNGIRTLESLGFQVKIAPHALDRHGFLAGTDTDRLTDLHAMFLDPEVDGIICLRGGYGSARLLPYIDFELIRSSWMELITGDWPPRAIENNKKTPEISFTRIPVPEKF